MKGTAHLHDEIPHPLPGEANDFFCNSASLDAAIDMLDAHSTPGDLTIGGFLFGCELPPAGLLGGHEGRHCIERKTLEAEILQKLASRRQGVRSGIGDPFVVHLALNRVTQKKDGRTPIDEQHVFHGVFLFLAAVIELLIIRVLGARDASLGAIVTKRGGTSSDPAPC